MQGQRQRMAAGLSILLATVAVTSALAQQRARGRPRPKPASTDAGSDNPYGDETLPPAAAASAGPVPATASGADAGPVPAPARTDVGDGGVRVSPLNPAASEMPGPPGVLVPSAAGVDYDHLIGEVAALRARVAAVADNLFVSRISIAVRAEGDHTKIGRFVVSLDDGAVFNAPAGFQPADEMTVYEHSVAPGKHAVTLDLDRKDTRDEGFRTSQRSRFIVDVPKDERLLVTLRVGDDSSMGGEFPADRSGKYDLRVRMKASAVAVKR